MYDSLWGHYSCRFKPVLARLVEGFTPIWVMYLSAFIDLTHEKKRRKVEIGVITLQHMNIRFLTLP